MHAIGQTPVADRANLVDERLAGRQTVLRFYHNQPMAVVARVFRNLLYDLRMPRLIDLLMMVGWAIVSVLVLYRDRLWSVVRNLPSDPGAQKLAGGVLVGFIPMAVIGLLTHRWIKHTLFNPVVYLINGFRWTFFGQADVATEPIYSGNPYYSGVNVWADGPAGQRAPQLSDPSLSQQ